ncbi:MAG: hypothetical protein ABI758_01450 [Candidatus Woesebacteria bacterium]
MKLLVTHRSPDLDAISSVWCFTRFHATQFADAKHAFVNAGESIDLRAAEDLGFSPEDVVHVDTGLGDFDHHQEERGMKRVCATSLVYDYVSHLHPELQGDQALQFLVEYVNAIDHFEECFWENATDLKNNLLIQNLIDGLQRYGVQDDEALMHFGFQCLDAAHASLSAQIQAKGELKKGTEFETKWGKAIALETAVDEVLKLSQKSGFLIAIRKDPNRGDIRIKAAPGKGIDLTPIYEKITEMDTVGRWYFHPGKTMLLNGSSKEMNRKPSPLTLEQIIEIFKKVK